MPVGMTIVADLYPPAERARIQAWVSSVWVIAAIIAPMIGAFLIAQASWSDRVLGEPATGLRRHRHDRGRAQGAADRTASAASTISARC